MRVSPPQRGPGAAPQEHPCRQSPVYPYPATRRGQRRGKGVAVVIAITLLFCGPDASAGASAEDAARYTIFHDQWASLMLTPAFTPDPDAVASVCKLELAEVQECMRRHDRVINDVDSAAFTVEVCGCMQRSSELRLCFPDMYTKLEPLFCTHQSDTCGDPARWSFPRIFGLKEPPRGDGTTHADDDLYKVYKAPTANPRKKAMLGTIPPKTILWDAQRYYITVDELKDVEGTMWVKLSNPEIFHYKTAWIAVGPTDAPQLLNFCPADELVPSVDFRKLNWTVTPRPYKSKRDKPGPTSLTQIEHDKATLPTYPVIGMSLAFAGLECGEMSATVQYIGNEGTAVLAVDNFMRHVDAVKRYVTEKAEFLNHGVTGFPGLQAAIPEWYYTSFNRCLGPIVRDVFGMDISRMRPGGPINAKCLKTDAPPEELHLRQLPIRPGTRKRYKKYKPVVAPTYTNGFSGLPTCYKPPKDWGNTVDTRGSFCQMAHFDGHHGGGFYDGLAAVHQLTEDRTCTPQQVRAKQCRRWAEGRPSTAFFRDRASGTERITMGSEHRYYRGQMFEGKHMHKSIKKKIRRPTKQSGSNEYEELIHLTYMKYNRVSFYPFNHLHAQYLDPSTFAMLDGDHPKLGRLTMNMFYNEIDQAQSQVEREWQIENGITCFNDYCIEGKKTVPGGVIDIPLTVFY